MQNQRRGRIVSPRRKSGLFESDHLGNRGGEAVPVSGFFFKLRAANAREGVELGAAIVLGGLPFRTDPALLFEFVERRIKRAVADLQHSTGDLLEAKADGVAVHGLEGEDFEEEQVEGTLYKIGGFAHDAPQ